jgi:hypothetical protein
MARPLLFNGGVDLRLRLLRVSLVVGLVGAFAGCITPSIPIPPPDPEQMTFEVQLEIGEARFEYSASGSYEGATVYVFNRDKRTGVIDTARDDGSVGPTLPFPAELGDQVVVTFEREQQTVSTCVVMRQGRQTSADRCR